jgi:hypothetical protein
MGRRHRRSPRPLPERAGGQPVGGRAAARILLVSLLSASGLLVSGCGSASRPRVPPAQRLCSQSQAAAARALNAPVRVGIRSAAASDIQCRLAGGGMVLAVEAQSSDQAWVEFDTTQSHFAQVFGPSSVHNSSEMPQNVTGVGPQAFWVRAQGELVTTNAQEGSLGTYVTVSVTHRARGAPRSLPIASAVARAALAASPTAR